MTSKDALIHLRILNRVGVVNRKGEIIKDTLPYKELYDILEKDLEILEILKKLFGQYSLLQLMKFTNGYGIVDMDFNTEELTESQYLKIKEWLDND